MARASRLRRVQPRICRTRIRQHPTTAKDLRGILLNHHRERLTNAWPCAACQIIHHKKSPAILFGLPEIFYDGECLSALEGFERGFESGKLVGGIGKFLALGSYDGFGGVAHKAFVAKFFLY